MQTSPEPLRGRQKRLGTDGSSRMDRIRDSCGNKQAVQCIYHLIYRQKAEALAVFEDMDIRAKWTPDLFTGRAPQDDAVQTKNCGEVGDAGIVADECSAGFQSIGQFDQWNVERDTTA